MKDQTPIICFTLCFMAACWAAISVQTIPGDFSAMTTVMSMIITGAAGFVTGKAVGTQSTKVDKTDTVQVTNEAPK